MWYSKYGGSAYREVRRDDIVNGKPEVMATMLNDINKGYVYNEAKKISESISEHVL